MASPTNGGSDHWAAVEVRGHRPASRLRWRGNRRPVMGADQHERPCPREGRGGTPMVVFAKVSIRAAEPAGPSVRCRRGIGRAGERRFSFPPARGPGPATGAGGGAGGGVDDRLQLPAARVVDVRPPPAFLPPVRAVQPDCSRGVGGQLALRLGAGRHGDVLPHRQLGGDRGRADHQFHVKHDMDMGRTNQWKSSSSAF